MRRWTSLLPYVLLVMFWLAVMSLPILAFALGMRGQVGIGQQHESHIRLFLVQDASAQGVGLEWARWASAECLQTQVRYLTWVGEGPSVTYCQCIDTRGAVQSQASGPCVLE